MKYRKLFLFISGGLLFCFSLYAQCGWKIESECIVTPDETCTVAPAKEVVSTVITEEPAIYPGMSKYHVKEALGKPAQVEKFRTFRRRKQGFYDEIWTYNTPSGPYVIYFKEKRVVKAQYE